MSLVLSASSSCLPSAFLILSLSTLAFAVGDPAGSCCSSLHAVQVRVVYEFLRLMRALCLVSVVLRLVRTTVLSLLSISGGRSVVMTPFSMIALFAWFLVT